MKPAQIITALALSMLAAHTQASILFDFESSAATSSPLLLTRPGTLSSLTFEEGGLSMTITRPSAATSTSDSPFFDVLDNSLAPGYLPVGWGNRALDPFFAGSKRAGKNESFFQINFSSAINFFSVEFGDFADDRNDELEIFAFSDVGGSFSANASANYLGFSSASVFGSSSLPNFSVGSISAHGIRSIEMRGGTPGRENFPHSVFYDNIRVSMVSSVPEPETYAMMLTGLGLIGILARRRRAKQA